MTELDLHLDGTSLSLHMLDEKEQQIGTFNYLLSLLTKLTTFVRSVH